MNGIGESWGRYPKAKQRLIRLSDRDTSLPQNSCSMLPHGMGRSYGDSCLNPGGALLLTRALDRFISFDAATGILRCESGVTLAEIIAICVPQGWFLPVTPGTRFVTVGGAIANDVHGKNHHRAGNFGHHVRAMEILRSDGQRIRCSPEENADFFAATVGGLGLTGLICWAEIALRPVSGPWMETETRRFEGLDEFFALSKEASSTHEYSVAWIDCMARGSSLGRGLITHADHASNPYSDLRAPCLWRPSFPFMPPVSLVNSATARAFNRIYYHGRARRHTKINSHYTSFFYPLDALGGWNKMYGSKGFLQHQCVVPPQIAREAITEILREISRSGNGSFLAVLKMFGPMQSLGMLSFPRHGATLAMDVPNTGASALKLLDRLDAIVGEAGGAVYPAKDARMSPAMFKSGYPAWTAFSQFIDPSFSSGFWRRVTEQACKES